MATVPPKTNEPSFLTLPAELRNKIYSFLLSPDPETPRILYHDRHGRKDALGLHPSLLRTNKQIHAEALPFLYDSHTFVIDYTTAVVQQCSGGSYPDHIPNTPPLLRDDQTHYHPQSRHLSDQDHDADSENPNSRFPHGVIYPHILPRLSNLELHTSPSAIWGSTMSGSVPSHIGPRIIELLNAIAEDSPLTTAQEQKKKLRVVVSTGWRGGTLFADQEDDKPWIPMKVKRRIWAFDRGLDIELKLRGAILEVGKVRDVKVEEDGKAVELRELDG